ncbi:Myb-like_DNA-binding domain-containing protein [Hexamita inflata]|uniref:Myb-like_DNA-binding domain-containing protein n=1 Tax=Hexamita inflata TaxID=28002 RepID=A0ABP1GHT7_9EUKA
MNHSRPIKSEYMQDGKYYNERGTEICGHQTPAGICRNPRQCRFHRQSNEIVLEPLTKKYLKKIKGAWQNSEHELFLKALTLVGVGRWSDISKLIQSRSSGQCQIHYYKMKQRLGITDEEFLNKIEYYGSMTVPSTQRFKSKEIAENTNQKVFEMHEIFDNVVAPIDKLKQSTTRSEKVMNNQYSPLPSNNRVLDFIKLDKVDNNTPKKVVITESTDEIPMGFYNFDDSSSEQQQNQLGVQIK